MHLRRSAIVGLRTNYRRMQSNIGGAILKLDIMKIMQILAEQGLTKCEFASRSGVSRQQVSTIMGRGTCAPRTAGKLAAGLGVHVAEIMKEVQ